ncbi:putative hexaprenyldihydroxybenzoate methyltransferase [Hibiscus syriacus]|uniref:Hexaprenyldihydroxybenzoate methyltransferase n=1 Tax=Hibiscus syriacus TaxID=106335 RepID=A0A6A3C287_HIBSY|nr:putative hexaprenyldihydroxybenzoate methyltransferase [Hibiscus syriacus]
MDPTFEPKAVFIRSKSCNNTASTINHINVNNDNNGIDHSHKSKLARTFHKVINLKSSTKFSSNNGIGICVFPSHNKFECYNSNPDQKISSRGNPKQKVVLEALVAKIFASVTAIKAAYAELQMAQNPYNNGVVQAADEAIVEELRTLSELKRKFLKRELDLSPQITLMLAEIQEQQSLMKTYEITIKNWNPTLKQKFREIDDQGNGVSELGSRCSAKAIEPVLFSLNKITGPSISTLYKKMKKKEMKVNKKNERKYWHFRFKSNGIKHRHFRFKSNGRRHRHFRFKSNGMRHRKKSILLFYAIHEEDKRLQDREKAGPNVRTVHRKISVSTWMSSLNSARIVLQPKPFLEAYYLGSLLDTSSQISLLCENRVGLRLDWSRPVKEKSRKDTWPSTLVKKAVTFIEFWYRLFTLTTLCSASSCEEPKRSMDLATKAESRFPADSRSLRGSKVNSTIPEASSTFHWNKNHKILASKHIIGRLIKQWGNIGITMAGM